MKKIALVTGASRGIGRGIALQLAREGWDVCVNCARELAAAEEVAAQIRAMGRKAIAVQADVADSADVAAMVRTTEAHFGPISLLVNNAGIAGMALFQDITDEMWDRYMGVNLGGARNTIRAVLPHMLQEKSGCIRDGSRVYVYQKLDHNDWYVVMDYPATILSIANSPQGSILQVMITIVLVISLTLVFIVAYNYTVNVTLARINASLDALNTGEDNNPEEAVPHFLNPLHQLERNADQMVLTVKDLMESRYRDRIAIAESQMKSLQAQIKPHFLYNTLDIIKWMVLDQRNEEAAQMVNSLSKYLRQSINKGPGIIPLREELELSKTYISIMQTRFKNRFTVNFEIEDAAELYQIPKLSLQPLLENALLHGILYCEKPEKELTVRAWVADGSVHIEVEDNGNGMTEETVRALEAGTAGYGLGNVRKRLALFSKNDGEFNIFSREGFGTCIAIRIPAIMQTPDTL